MIDAGERGVERRWAVARLASSTGVCGRKRQPSRIWRDLSELDSEMSKVSIEECGNSGGAQNRQKP